MFHYRKTLKSIMNVKNKVDSWSGTVEELCKELNGQDYPYVLEMIEREVIE